MHRIIFDINKIIDKLELDSKISTGVYEFIVEKCKIKYDQILGFSYSEKPKIGVGKLSNFEDEYYGYVIFMNNPEYMRLGIKVEENAPVIRILEVKNIIYTDLFKPGDIVYFSGTLYDVQ